MTEETKPVRPDIEAIEARADIPALIAWIRHLEAKGAPQPQPATGLVVELGKRYKMRGGGRSGRIVENPDYPSDSSYPLVDRETWFGYTQNGKFRHDGRESSRDLISLYIEPENGG